jgi:hypothetical protein
MSVQVISIVLGGILLFLALVGGGFELKELKVPKVGIGVRVLSAIVGVLFVCLGFSAQKDNPSGSSGGQEQRDGTASGKDPVEFTLTDHLGEEQISEQVTVLIDGKDVGNLTVNRQYPNSRLLVMVANPGQHSYSVESTAVFYIQGTPVRYTGAGQGIINVENGRSYSLRGSITGNTWLVSLLDEGRK